MSEGRPSGLTLQDPTTQLGLGVGETHRDRCGRLCGFGQIILLTFSAIEERLISQTPVR